ncbi:MAG: hypothetical protein ACLSAP_06830 [Oscillospiraceae bacterium]
MVRRPLAGGDVLICRTKGCPTVSCSMALLRRALQTALDTLFGGFLVQFSPGRTGLDSLQTASGSRRKTPAKRSESCRRQSGRLCDLLEQGVYTLSVFRNAKRFLISAYEI